MRVRLVAEPTKIIGTSEDQWHAIMDLGDHLISVGSDDREGSHPLAGSRLLPILPNSAQSERITVLHGDSVGLLCLALDRLPLEKTINRQDATTPAVGVTKRRQCAGGLALRVDRLAPALRVFTAMGDQTPTQRVKRNLGGVVVAPNDQ